MEKLTWKKAEAADEITRICGCSDYVAYTGSSWGGYRVGYKYPVILEDGTVFRPAGWYAETLLRTHLGIFASEREAKAKCRKHFRE